MELIAKDVEDEHRFQAAIHGIDLPEERAPGVGGLGNNAWQQAMNAKRSLGGR